MRSVVFFMRPGRARLVRDVDWGDCSRDFLYGFGEVAKVFPDAALVEAETGLKLSWIGGLWRFLDRFVVGLTGIRFHPLAVFSNWSDLKETRVIVTNIDTIALTLLVCRWWGLLDASVIHMAQGTTNRFESGSLSRVSLNRYAWLVRLLFRELSRLSVLGQGARFALKRHIGLNPRRIQCLQFGVDTGFWSPQADAPLGEYFLSVGSDAARDYATLARSCLGMPLRVVTRLPVVPGGSVSEVVSDINDPELRELYRGARAVLIPLMDVSQPSGQSVALQAMAIGKVVVITRTQGFWDLESFRDGETILFAGVADAESWESLAREILEDEVKAKGIGERARRLVTARFSVENFGASLARLCEEVSGEYREARV